MSASSALAAAARRLAPLGGARGGAARRGPAAAAVQVRRRSALTVEGLRAPVYEKVPISQEDPTKVLADMPSLVLGGPSTPSTPSKVVGKGLDEPISVEDADHAAAGVAPSTMPETRFGVLPNGVRIASVDRKGMCASVGLFVHAGSRYETPDMACIPHALSCMAFRSSAHLSHLHTLKTLEQLGAVAYPCRVGREDILYSFDTLREYVPVVLPLMLANVLCPTIAEEEVAAAAEMALETRQMMEENAESWLSELLQIAAYKGGTLGNPLYAEEQDLPKFTAENIRDYIRRACRPDRLILVGVNVDFDDLCKWTARSFAEFSPAGEPPSPTPWPPAEKAVYTGGEMRVQRENPLCHLMFGWEVESGWNGPDLAAVTVLQMFLGGGGSFSTGGPGKGMHTRLYTHVLNRYHWVESIQASSMMHTDSGLFAIYATVMPRSAGDFVMVLAQIFKGLTQISPEELQRAKNALKSSIHMNLEMRAVVMEDIGRQLLLSGKVGTTQEFGRMVDAVTTEDLIAVLRKCLKTELTMVAYGAIDAVPSFSQVKKVLQDNCP